MNKGALKKSAWTHVRIRPVAKRFLGPDGPQLPPVDDTWTLEGVFDDGVRLRNNATHHGTLLGFDQIHHYASDPERGAGNGFLILNTQIHFGGDDLWTEPTFRPGEALPDQFASIRNWDRRNDTAYVQSLSLYNQPAHVSDRFNPLAWPGARIQIANNFDLRRKYEAQGFWPETITPQECIMRRDYTNGVLRTEQAAAPAGNTENPLLKVALFGCLCVGVGLLVAAR